jgi:hypothetical protein
MNKMAGANAPLVQTILYILFILSWWINGLSWFDPALGGETRGG